MRFALALILTTLTACSSGAKQGGPIGAGGRGGSGSGLAGASGQGGASRAGSGGMANAQGGSSGGSSADPSSIALPRVYPRVRAATPTALIANPNYAALPLPRADDDSPFGSARQAQTANDLAVAIQERFYSGGPTELLRIVSDLDGRVQGLDLAPAAHACLSAPPVAHTYALPGGQEFQVQLQCLQRFGTPGSNSGWVAFGIARPTATDAGAPPADASTAPEVASDDRDGGAGVAALDVYLIEGQEGGNGGAYRIDRNGNVEGWLAVAERDLPGNSQVIMHLWIDAARRTLELALAGSGVGFCAAHLKTDPTFLFVSGKTNAPPPPGITPEPGTQYCDSERAGCYRAEDLASDLGSESESCATVGPSSFDIAIGLDSDTSADAGANVATTEIYHYFNEPPPGVPNF